MNKLQNIIKDLQTQRFTLDKLNEILDIINFNQKAIEILDLDYYIDDFYIIKNMIYCYEYDNGSDLLYSNKYINIYEYCKVLKIDLFDENKNNIDSVYFKMKKKYSYEDAVQRFNELTNFSKDDDDLIFFREYQNIDIDSYNSYDEFKEVLTDENYKDYLNHLSIESKKDRLLINQIKRDFNLE